MTIEDICRNSEFLPSKPLDPNKTSIIKVIGVGGGGGNAVGYMYRQGVKDVKFVVANTDSQALQTSPVPDRVMLGSTGLGAGDKPEVARLAAEESIDAINALFDENTKMVFITAGMGGGTGTGAAPVVARAAKEHGVLTVGIVTIPFEFEGKKKIIKALEGAEEIRKHVDALLLINNERLIDIYPDLDFDTAFSKADDTLATAARSISHLITNDDVKINIDFNDVDTTLRNGGSAIISCGYGEGENRVEDAIRAALNSPLLRNNNILGSKRLLFDLAYNPTADEPFRMGEMTAFSEFVNSIEDVEVIHGVSYNREIGNKILVTILASGFETESSQEAGPAVKVAASTPGVSPQKPKGPAGPIISTDTVTMDFQRKNYVILQPDQLDDDAIIDRLENTPTFSRNRKTVAAIANKDAAAPSASPIGQTTSTSRTSDASSDAIIF
ncbi:MAG: cell division protein FtsZ [Muribaculaceae bacterium]|nr:cell division protein FtsZ [Muribaculaceae bacterium]